MDSRRRGRRVGTDGGLRRQQWRQRRPDDTIEASGAGPSGATITIGSNGAVSPASVSITVGQSVTFANSSGSSREIASDPHPAHTSCPSINVLGILGNGQTKLTNSFGGAGTCTFHDHGQPDNNSLKGTITIR